MKKKKTVFKTLRVEYIFRMLFLSYFAGEKTKLSTENFKILRSGDKIQSSEAHLRKSLYVHEEKLRFFNIPICLWRIRIHKTAGQIRGLDYKVLRQIRVSFWLRFMFYIKYNTPLRFSDSTVSEDAGIEPRTAMFAWQSALIIRIDLI
jgi:hypothetical protein